MYNFYTLCYWIERAINAHEFWHGVFLLGCPSSNYRESSWFEIQDSKSTQLHVGHVTCTIQYPKKSDLIHLLSERNGSFQESEHAFLHVLIHASHHFQSVRIFSVDFPSVRMWNNYFQFYEGFKFICFLLNFNVSHHGVYFKYYKKNQGKKLNYISFHSKSKI